MLLPALNGAKEEAQSTSCKNNLRQMSLAMRMYVDDFHYYPWSSYWTNDFLYSGVSWEDRLLPYYRIAWTNPSFHCPAYRGYIVHAGDYPASKGLPHAELGDGLGSYGYNGSGVEGFTPSNLGLGDESWSYDRTPRIADGEVLVPSDMIEFGESLLELSPGWGISHTFLWTGIDTLFISTTPLPEWYMYPLWHGKNCNVVFCDSHVEGMAPAYLFNVTNTASRWNNDHQPHPELW
jgi:prepilin-type processing-associated H-X9-DG protein